MAPKERSPKCPVAGCSIRMNAQTSGTCKMCHKSFCKEHCYPADHACQRLSGGMSRSASAPQLVPKVQPGVLVNASAASKVKGDAAAAPAQVRVAERATRASRLRGDGCTRCLRRRRVCPRAALPAPPQAKLPRRRRRQSLQPARSLFWSSCGARRRSRCLTGCSSPRRRRRPRRRAS